MSEGWLMTHQSMLAVGARGLNRGITRAIHAAIARKALATLCMEPLLALSRLSPVLSAFIDALLAPCSLPAPSASVTGALFAPPCSLAARLPSISESRLALCSLQLSPSASMAACAVLADGVRLHH